MKMLYIGREGKIIGRIEKNKFEDLCKSFAPIIELETSSIMEALSFDLKGSFNFSDGKEVEKSVERIYREYGKFGHFDDAIMVSETIEAVYTTYNIDFIGKFAFRKPALTSDLVPIIRDKSGQYFFIGILRKFPPAVGKLALIGGFREVKGIRFETVIENVVSEAKAEAGIRILQISDYPEDLLRIPYHEEVKILVRMGKNNEIEVDSKLLHVGSLYPYTSKNEEECGEKRVHETCATVFLADVDRDLDEEVLRSYLKPGDDALEAVAWNISDRGEPDLALPHHREIFQNAVKKLGIEKVLAR